MLKLERGKGRLSWAGKGRGVGTDGYYVVQLFNRNSGFTVSFGCIEATHEIYINRFEGESNRLIFREQYDFRLPSRSPDAAAQWVAGSIVNAIRRTAIPRMLGDRSRGFRGKVQDATPEEIADYWGWIIENSFEALLQMALVESQIPRALYEMDKTFYLTSYPP
jgi:hypothetical protein